MLGEIAVGPRIGIDNSGEAKDYPRRFGKRGNLFVSRRTIKPPGGRNRTDPAPGRHREIRLFSYFFQGQVPAPFLAEIAFEQIGGNVIEGACVNLHDPVKMAPGLGQVTDGFLHFRPVGF